MSAPPLDQVSGAEQARWFAEEVHPHEPALRAWLRSRYPSLGDVDDVVHESYLNLLRRHPAGAILFTKAYLFTAARNAALRVIRKSRIYSDISVNDLPDSQLLDDGTPIPDAVNVHQEDLLVAEAIAQLPRRCADIITLRIVHGHTYTEIAEKLDLTEATVRVQISRAIKKCARFMRDRGASHRS